MDVIEIKQEDGSVKSTPHHCQGTTECSCHVYRWNYNDKIVISDIDGTISKSDVLGLRLPIIGWDWTQPGVAALFTKIVNNGYRIVYLSARPIGWTSSTKEYLSSIKQDEVKLPDGPIFLNPTSMINACISELGGRSKEFKIDVLRKIKKLFPEQETVFFAGFGNRETDVGAYQAVGIPDDMIFTVNPNGVVRHELTTEFQTSYGSMASNVDQFFPPI